MIKIHGHVLTHGNIKDSQLDAAIKENYPNGIDFCYTDPPWGNSNLKYWETMNKKMNGQSTDQIDQLLLENRVVRLICDNVRKYAFIVYGVHQAESLMNIIKEQKEVTDVQYIEKKYKSGNKWLKNCVIAITLNNAEPIDWSALLVNQDEQKGLHVVCKALVGKYNSCMDIFIGQGFYLEILHKYGFKVIGNELNQSRLNKAVARLK